ncbi:MAG: ATP-binding cassette domain-containing protein [Bacteroidales bacterium]|nr:ATP-binding cassette domain-containing protein [Bacteroidales bacterium]
MNETTIYTLLRILAHHASGQESTEKIDAYVDELLSENVSTRLKSDFTLYYGTQKAKIQSEQTPEIAVAEKFYLSKDYCTELRQTLTLEDRYSVMVTLLEQFRKSLNNHDFAEFIDIISLCLNIDTTEVKFMKRFISFCDYENIDPSRLITLSGMQRNSDTHAPDINSCHKITGFHKVAIAGLMGCIRFFHLPDIQCYLMKYYGESRIYLDNMEVDPEKIYIYQVGSAIKGHGFSPIYFNFLSSIAGNGKNMQRAILTAEDIEYKYLNSKNGIKKFRISEETGQLIGIMGSSGVGKSTLFNLLTGKQKPNEGRILINGYDIHTEMHAVQGIIGLVPQDDLLFENLTVYQNMLYNAKLCFGNYTRKQIELLVKKVLSDLELWEIRNLKVGSPLNKVISGGQRKRLNIGLELLREPTILFVDEPTSGLSSSDSLMVMKLLKAQANKGKLVITNIHQPSDKVFRLFDKLWVLDKGGYPIYSGAPLDAIVYFKRIVNPLSNTDGGCINCGHINPEQILEVVERKVINDEGRYTATRQIEPEVWHKHYVENIQNHVKTNSQKETLPTNNFRLPNVIKQLKIFSIRNLLSKLTNKQYVLLNLLEPIVLAFILAFFIKYSTGDNYIFANNKNLPAFIFMSVIVSLFLGLSVSAEEIIGDRKILERETFLNLSRFSYLNAKIIYLFSLSALQMLLFVLVGNTIIEIRGLTMQYWLVLFSAACFANLLGLIISSAMNSVVSIYITIPFILVPQILLSGTVVDYDNLHPTLTRKVYVPGIADIMPSRWAYEAIAVEQFTHNKFERNFFDYEMAASQSSFRASFLIPRLQSKLEESIRLSTTTNPDQSNISRHIKLIGNELKVLEKTTDIPPFEFTKELTEGKFNEQIAEELTGYLFFLKRTVAESAKKATHRRDSLYNYLTQKLGTDGFYSLKQKHYNNTLAEWLLKNNEVTKYLETDDRVIQKYEPIYMQPDHPWGRAHLYAPYKLFNGVYVRTIWFNITVIWIGSLLLYTTLQLNFIRRIALLIESFKKSRQNR